MSTELMPFENGEFHLVSAMEARELTDRIKVGVEAVWELIKQAYMSRAWSVLGYDSWDDYCTREFGTSRLRLPREERPEVVASMREIGMSTRAIAAATGISDMTVRRELSGATNVAPVSNGPVIGLDGKTYTPPPPKPSVTDLISADELAELNSFDAALLEEEEPERAANPRKERRHVVSDPKPVDPDQVATIVADPPWRYGNTSTRGAAEDHYPTMSIEELCDLDIARNKAADQSHLYLWTTAGHLPEAFKVMSAWGFEYKTYLVWVKTQMGMGNYFRVSTELVLFGIRGGLLTNTRSTRNNFTAPRGKHSAKPPQFHDLVMDASPGPYLEMFSRCRAKELQAACTCSKCRLGWEVWGNQA